MDRNDEPLRAEPRAAVRRQVLRRGGLARMPLMAFLPLITLLLIVAVLVGVLVGRQAALQAEQGQSGALGRAVLLTTLGVALVGGTLAAVVITFISRRIAIPIIKLTEAAAEMAAGDLSHRVSMDRPDEIGVLSQAFDDMADRVEDLIGTLEQRVADRTRALERRAFQLQTASEVGRAAASILELDALARRVVDLVQQRFGLYYVGLFLLDDAGEDAVLQAGTGEAGQAMKAAGHRLEVGGFSMVGMACAQRLARIALDVGQEAVRFDNPLLPETRSEMAVPLMVGERVLGALDVQSVEAGAFSEEDITVLQLLADQVAVAVDNARRLSEEAGVLEATSPIFRFSRRLATATTMPEIVQVIMASVAETGVDGCTVGWLEYSPAGEPESIVFLGAWDRQGASGFSPGASFSLADSPLPLKMMQASWIIRDIAQESRMPEGVHQFLARFGGQALANVPLKTGERVIGFVIVQRAVAGPFSPVSLRLYETMADQAAVALERARLYQDAQRRAVREELVGQVTARIRETLDMDTVLKTAAREMRQVLELSEAEVRLGRGGPGLQRTGRLAGATAGDPARGRG